MSSFHESFLIELCATIKDLSGTRDIWIINFFKSIKQRKYISQLATKDFVRAKINQVGAEISEIKSDYRSLRQEMKFYAIGLGVLIIILQPKVFDFITTFLK